MLRLFFVNITSAGFKIKGNVCRGNIGKQAKEGRNYHTISSMKIIILAIFSQKFSERVYVS